MVFILPLNVAASRVWLRHVCGCVTYVAASRMWLRHEWELVDNSYVPLT